MDAVASRSWGSRLTGRNGGDRVRGVGTHGACTRWSRRDCSANLALSCSATLRVTLDAATRLSFRLGVKVTVVAGKEYPETSN